ncbi:hypothetical protein [Tateyamaria sp.]|uniref:hypothetical protein n=1 Tax=Tateyamaria sp. TaxID=1929288 RepID=UPI00329B92B1
MRDLTAVRTEEINVCFLRSIKSLSCLYIVKETWKSMSSNYTAARRAKLEDLAEMSRLSKRPGHTSIGSRSLAFCHPNHSKETLEAYFSMYPQGIFVSEEDDHIISFACAVRTSIKAIEEPIAWSDATAGGKTLGHQKRGQWLYVSRLAYTAGPGHAHVTKEIGPLLIALQNLAVKQGLAGVAIATQFPGRRERSGTTPFQRSCIDDPHDQVRSGLNPTGIAYHAGFRHCLALPNYLGDGRHFALMVWRRNIDQ